MKKQLLWMLAAVLTFCGTTTVFTSCDDDDVENVMETLNIVGRWNTSAQVSPQLSDDIEITFSDAIEFKTDGTVATFGEDGRPDAGTWTLRDKALTITWKIEGASFSEVYKVQDGWTRDRMVVTYNFTDEDINGKKVNYTVYITMTRMK